MRWAAAIALALVASRARAHSLAPEEVLASVAEPVARVALGVEGATIDARNPRVLLVRVGPGWFGLPPGVRLGAAEGWRSSWRSATPRGVVAVLDAGTSRPVVRYGPGGRVVGLEERPQR